MQEVCSTAIKPSSPWLQDISKAIGDGTETSATLIIYRGRHLEVTFQPDEEGCTPKDANVFVVSKQQAIAWESGKWWFHHITVRVIDSVTGEPVDVLSVITRASHDRVPSFINPNEIVHGLADKICDDLDAHDVVT